MLKLTLADTVVDLLDNELSIVQTSPYPLVSTNSAGNFFFNFNLPATDDLKRIFRFYHRPQSKDHSVEVPFRLDAEGLVFEGMAKVTEASRKSYEIFCPVGNGNFNKAIKEVRLNEIDLGGDRILLSKVKIVDANLSEEISYFGMGSPDPFQAEIIPEFGQIILNQGNHLNSSGTQFTSEASTGQVKLRFDIKAMIIYGYFAFRVYQNNDQVWEEIITGDTSFDVYLSSNTSTEITWDLFIQNSDSINQGLFDLDGVIYNTSKIQIFTEGILFDPSFRYPQSDFALCPIENPEIFSNWDDDFYSIDNTSIKVLYSQYFKVINYFKDSIFPVTINGEYSAGNVIIPFPYLAYLVKRIAYHFNLRIENNPFESELKQVILINHFCQNEFLTDNTKLITPKEGFNLQDHVPDMIIYDFLKHICNLFGLGYEVNNERKTVTFNFLDDIIHDNSHEDISHLVVDELQVLEQDLTGVKFLLKTPTSDKYFENVKDLAGLNLKGTVQILFDLPNPGTLNDCYFVKLSNAYFAWKYNPDTYTFGWVKHSTNYIRSKELGTEVKEISPEIVPVMIKYSISDDVMGAPKDRQWLIPASHQPGQFEGAPETFQTKWTPMLAYYHGMFPSYPSGQYPFASPDIYDLWGNQIPGVELSLLLDGPHGLFEKKWRKYVQWRIQAIVVKVKIIPDRQFLKNLSFSKPKMINGMKYLLVEFRGNISKDGPKVAELTLLAL